MRVCLGEDPPLGKAFVNPGYLISEVVCHGFVFRVNVGLLLTETSKAKGWSCDFDFMNCNEIVAGGAVVRIAYLDNVKFLNVFAPFVDVVDSSAHLEWRLGGWNWISLGFPVGLEDSRLRVDAGK